MKRSELCENFLKKNNVNCCNPIDNEPESHFSWRGCDCCQNGLGTSVYDCHGYDSKAEQIVDLGQVCHECLCYFANGECDEQIG